MQRSDFKLEIFSPGRADVYLAAEDARVPWDVVEQLDRSGIRVVGPVPDVILEAEQIRLILRGCSGLVTAFPCCNSGWRKANPNLPLLDIHAEAPIDLAGFQEVVLGESDRIRPYAFMIGRLERDFRHAREAIRVAVEGAAGIPFLWVDDGCHRTNIESVRERTRLLIKHATFVIADLTLGVESPERENPSRAHEIGMAIAYERPLMLCSQEPRRYPYFSIGDMQMAFWSTEDELEARVQEWIYANREAVARHVFNYQLKDAIISRPAFTFDPRQRYVGPKAIGPLDLRRLLAFIGVK